MRKSLATVAMIAVVVSLGGCDLFSGGKADDPTALTSAPDAQTASAGVTLDSGAFEGMLSAVGANEAWWLTIDPATGVLLDERDQGETLRATYAPPVEAAGGVTFAAAPLTISVSAGPCTGGDAGVTYPFRAQVTKADGTVLSGCLYRPWTTQIVALAPAVMACLAINPGEAGVSYLEQEGDGRVLVRVVGETGAEVDCRAPLSGGAQLVSTPADPNVRFPGERDALFYRAPGENPGGECYTAPEVKDASGAVIGWLADPSGC
jgi:hypothetical protein